MVLAFCSAKRNHCGTLLSSKPHLSDSDFLLDKEEDIITVLYCIHIVVPNIENILSLKKNASKNFVL